MKATTIATKYPALSKVADLLTSCRRPVILDDLCDLLSIGYVRPQREAGHGRWSHIEDHRVEIQEALDACSIAVVKFNDATRSGRTGDIWVLKGEWAAVAMDNGETGYHAVGEGYATQATTFSKYSSVPMVDYVKAQASKVSLANIDKLPG